ncbi:MAG: rod-binding protein [Paracoccaceae bacterium]
MTSVTTVSTLGGSERITQLKTLSEKIEAQFLAEMLKSAGLSSSSSSFGGGIGEDQFSSFLVQEYADATVKAGGIGVAESIFQSLLMQQSQT